MKILWVGPFLSDSALIARKAANQAAAKWSRGLLSALADAGCEIAVIDHAPNQRWPKGKVFWEKSDKACFLDWFPVERVPYCNAIGIKEIWLEFAYKLATRKMFTRWRPDVVVCYNSLHSWHVSVMKEARRHHLPVVPIILDGDDPQPDGWQRMLRDNRFATGIVMLSWWIFRNYPKHDIPKLHMDGGAAAFIGTEPKDIGQSGKPFLLVHTGALDVLRGLPFMKSVIGLCKRKDVRFVFCGKCDVDGMRREFGNNPCVEITGFISAEEVDDLCREADVFLSFRAPGIGENRVNYPSKIPNYLAFGKPVVSTWLESLSPDHKDVLCIPEDDTPESFLHKIDEVLAWDFNQRMQHFKVVRDWFLSRKTWSIQSHRLYEFLKDIMHTHCCS